MRQYVGPAGQSWTTLAQIQRTHRNMFQRLELNLYGIGSAPQFAIGQRALLIRTPGGNVLWDCISLLDDATIDIITALGGVRAIAISHPHFYTTVLEWSRAFDAPVSLHAADRQWMMRPDPAIQFWEGETRDLLPGIRLTRVGGHFAGSSVLIWDAGVVAGLRFDRIYSGFWDAHVREDARAAVQRSAARYIAWSRGDAGPEPAR
ncbi:MAG: MBL fold metallo-hydrolase [Thermoflexales bacterium]